jgi:hypothetical protein
MIECGGYHGPQPNPNFYGLELETEMVRHFGHNESLIAARCRG